MANSQQIKELRRRSEKICSHCTLLDEYKFYGDQGRKYFIEPQVYEHNQFTKVQNFLYKRALYGLSIYNKTEIKRLEPKEKSKVLQLQERTQEELNIWKQQLIIKSSNRLLALFHNSPIAQAILSDEPFVDPLLPNEFTFGDLGIRKEHVVERLHLVGILPKNFYEKTNETKIKAL